jgi:type I restriction enzyme M protein
MAKRAKAAATGGPRKKPGRTRKNVQPRPGDDPPSPDSAVAVLTEDPQSPDEEGEEETVPEGQLVCALTQELRTATPQEETLQSFIEQMHNEYGIALEDMERDVRIRCVSSDPKTGRERSRSRAVSLAVFAPHAQHDIANITRVVLVGAPSAKADDRAIALLEEVLANLSSDHNQVFGAWTNGTELAFRMREFEKRSGNPRFIPLTDIPGPEETLAELESAERRPLRVAAGDSLLRTFKRCHDYLYGNQSMRGDRAFWQLLYLIFCKIHDEQKGSRRFFVGATEANAEQGQRAVTTRLHALFNDVRTGAYRDVFDGSERLELNPRALAYVAGELGRYSLLTTDADAKGLAYEAITSSTLKRERGQFFTPRNVIRMMVDMVDPQPGKRVLDPACGSGGFLVVALAHHRKRLLRDLGVPEHNAVPQELRKIEPQLRKYAQESLFGIDVDPDLRKAARMNMVMNNDGHGNIMSFNSLEFGVEERGSKEMARLEDRKIGHGTFDYVFTNPPFGSKIPVSDRKVLEAFDLGHSWTKTGDIWQRGPVLRRVPPEVLFIEACCKFLKPGSGVMGIVLPNGILGNPGEQMEAVRWWMLRHMELLASVNLSAETFLPQVSVQASCLFLRRRDESELRFGAGTAPKQRPVFMAIAEQVGHGRRGEISFVRKPDGSEELRQEKVLERRERAGRVVEKLRMRQSRVVADDLPWIAEQYHHHVHGKRVEEN